MTESHDLPSPEPLNAPGTALRMVRRAATEGASDARDAADRAWSATGLFLSRFVYTTCYTVSYGVVFPSALLSRSVPRDGVVVRGLIDGASAAVRKIEDMRGLPRTELSNGPLVAPSAG